MTRDNPLTIEDLPDEVLEFILGLIPPYKDLHDCLQVSKRWRKCVLNVTKAKRRNLQRAITTFDVAWKSVTPAAMAPSITKRYSHNAVVHENSMYVFGGCTCNMTTFNDLWRLDLSKRQWVRPLTMGTYPAPKACSSMVCYNDYLVLFGGWTYPASYPLHQSWLLFNELHVYDIKANRWSCINPRESPPPTAGHSVSVHGDWMIVFGGLQRPCGLVHSTKTNEIWKLNLKEWAWYKQEMNCHSAPKPRYGQSQIALDEHNLLMIGGSGGPNSYYSDVWVLNMSSPQWKWIPVPVRNEVEAPSNIWSNPACKVGDKVIILNKTRNSTIPPLMYYAKGVWESNRRNPPEQDERQSPRIDLASRRVDRDENVNGRRGVLRNSRRKLDQGDDQPSTSSNHLPNRNRVVYAPLSMNLAAFATENPNPLPQARKEQYDKRVDNLKGLLLNVKTPEVVKLVEPKKNILSMYVLDVSHALDVERPYVNWLACVKDNDLFIGEGPEETILYTLVEGKSELIMFGGIQKDPSSLASTTNLSNQVSNSLHFITAPRYII